MSLWDYIIPEVLPKGMFSNNNAKNTKQFLVSVYDAVTISAHVYMDRTDSILRNDWIVAPQSPWETTKVKGQLYQRKFAGEMQYVYAFAGSTLNVDDWVNNAKQMIGLSNDYKLAVEEAEKISSKYKNCKLAFVGHSKGGGEAILCSLKTGRPAVVFNPAPVSLPTKLFNGIFYDSCNNIDIYVNSKDPLYNANNIAKYYGLNGLEGRFHRIESKGFENIHSIDFFLKHFGVI